jgi:hypothetical protein
LFFCNYFITSLFFLYFGGGGGGVGFPPQSHLLWLTMAASPPW